eukprot:8093205-Alexandrium_andersonii.AAC.1
MGEQPEREGTASGLGYAGARVLHHVALAGAHVNNDVVADRVLALPGGAVLHPLDGVGDVGSGGLAGGHR